MTERSALVSRFGEHFEKQGAPTLVCKSLLKSGLAVMQIGCDANLGVAKLMPPEDAFVVGLNVRECAAFDYSLEGRPVVRSAVSVGDVMIHDMSLDPICDIHRPFRTLMFYMSRKTLNEIAYNSSAAQINGLRLSTGLTVFDPVMSQLGAALLPAFERPNEVCGLFVDHVLVAASMHIAHVYGHMRKASRPIRGGLAPWQERRAKEMLRANLGAETSLSCIAAECGLSVGHFARAFQQSTGVAPHRWLQMQRIEKAKNLLCGPSLSIAAIALDCGFANQSHFSHAFVQATHLSPGTWRRMRIQMWESPGCVST